MLPVGCKKEVFGNSTAFFASHNFHKSHIELEPFTMKGVCISYACNKYLVSNLKRFLKRFQIKKTEQMGETKKEKTKKL